MGNWGVWDFCMGILYYFLKKEGGELFPSFTLFHINLS